MSPKRLLPLFVAALAIILSAAAYGGWRWVRPKLRADPEIGPDDGLEEVYFRSKDGIRLRGIWMPGRSGYPSVIVCHGYSRNIAEPWQVALWLRETGYNVFVFDFRGCGKSQRAFTTIGAKETLDVLAAVDWLKRRQPGRIAVYGISMGAISALMAASHNPDISALALDSPFARLDEVVSQRLRQLLPGRWLLPMGHLSVRLGEVWSRSRVALVRPIDYAGLIATCPVLIIYGDEDSLVPLSHPEELFASISGPKEIWAAAGSRHAMARHDYPLEYRQRLESFLARHLPADRETAP